MTGSTPAHLPPAPPTRGCSTSRVRSSRPAPTPGSRPGTCGSPTATAPRPNCGKRPGAWPWPSERSGGGRAPPERRTEPGGDVGEDLKVVLVGEGERQREGDLVDLAESHVRV